MATDQPDHDDVYNELEDIVEDTEQTRLRITLDNGDEIEGYVTDASRFGSGGIDVTVDFVDAVEHDGDVSPVGHVTQTDPSSGSDEAATLSLSAGDDQPQVGDVAEVERIDD